MANYDVEKDLLFQAAASPIGIVIETSDVQKSLVRLGLARREERDSLPPLEFRRSINNPDGEIWIVKVAARREAPPEAPPPPIQGIPPDGITDISLDDLGL